MRSIQIVHFNMFNIATLSGLIIRFNHPYKSTVIQRCLTFHPYASQHMYLLSLLTILNFRCNTALFFISQNQSQMTGG